MKMSKSTSQGNSTNAKGAIGKDEKNVSERHKQDHHAHLSKNYISNLPDAKWIHIYLNGDEHFTGCRCVVNHRYYRNLDMFLSYLTERLKPSFGALRNVYTPVNGHPVLKLEDFVSKHKYVVAGNERFKKLEFGYADSGDRKLRRTAAILKNNFKVSKAKPLCFKALNIYLYHNGNFKKQPQRISLHPQELENWDQTFKKIADSMKCGSIKRIYLLNGKPIQNIEELVSNQSYVVVGKHEVFKYGQYAAIVESDSSSSKVKPISYHSSRKSSSLITPRSSALQSQTSARASVTHDEVHTTNSSSFQQQRQDFPHSLNITEMGNGVELDSSYPLKQKESFYSNKAKINLDDDFSGVFRSKIQNDLTVGALEIEDSLETIIDVPVDLLEAEEVEDDITPDMERSMQHLTLDVPEKIVAYLPTIQNKTNSDARHVSANKYNLNQSQTIDIRNVYA